MTNDEARKAADGLARKVYEQGGPDAVKRSEALRERAMRELERAKAQQK